MTLDNSMLEGLNSAQLRGMLANRLREEKNARGWILRRAMEEERKQIEAILAKRKK